MSDGHRPIVWMACRHDEIAGDCQKCVADGISGSLTFSVRITDEMMGRSFDLKMVGPPDDDIMTIKATVELGMFGDTIKTPRYAIVQSKFTRESLQLSRLTPEKVLNLVRDNMYQQMRRALIDGIDLKRPPLE